MKKLALALFLAMMAPGCVVHDHGYGPHGHGLFGVAVEIEPGHVHSDWCGHHYHGGHWYYHRGHRHGAGCGHHYRGGVWIRM